MPKSVVWMIMTFTVLLRPLFCQDRGGDLEQVDTETTLATPFSELEENKREPNYPDYYGDNETDSINGTWNGTDEINSTTGTPLDTTTLPPVTPVTDAPTTSESVTESDFLLNDFCTCDLNVGIYTSPEGMFSYFFFSQGNLFIISIKISFHLYQQEDPLGKIFSLLLFCALQIDF